MADGAELKVKDDGDGVVVGILTHPPVNSLTRGLIAELGNRLASWESDPVLRAVILTGDGAYFSAGADLKEMATIEASEAPKVVEEGQRTFARLAALPVPTIAALNGLAVGGGLELALACDLRIAGESTKLGAPEVGFGLMPAYGGTQRLPRVVGPAKAKELIFSGAMIPAAEAARIGLVNRVVPAGQELRAARDLAHTIASKGPRAVRASKAAIDHAVGVVRAEDLAMEAEAFRQNVLGSDDLAEGIAAFLERRPPKFAGK